MQRKRKRDEGNDDVEGREGGNIRDGQTSSKFEMPQKRARVDLRDISCSEGSGSQLLHVRVGIKCANREVFVYARPNTTDVKVIEEVLQRQVYRKKGIEFGVAGGETWLDLGANIGTFAMFAMACGARRVVCVEPEPTNLSLLNKNLETFDAGYRNELASPPVAVVEKVAVGTQRGETELFLCKGDANKYRHTIYKKRGRQSITVPIVHFRDLLEKHGDVTCVKMDIEGAEIEILENMASTDWDRYGIQKLVFEYTFDHDRSIPRFNAIIATLKKHFDVVYFSRVKTDEKRYNYFPAADMVYCMKQSNT